MFTDIIFFFLPVKQIGSHVPCSVVDSALITQYIKSEKKKNVLHIDFLQDLNFLALATKSYQ